MIRSKKKNVLSNQRIINAPDGWTSFYGDGKTILENIVVEIFKLKII